MGRTFDIVSFAVPYPPNYGGVIDVFYRLKALSGLYNHVRLHCFSYRDRQPQAELDQLCEVRYYPRSAAIRHHFDRRPFIVASRQSRTLVDTLAQDDGPILFEGLHTCAAIADQRLAHRFKAVRMHNVEHVYYRDLARQVGGLRALHFLRESRKLERYAQHVLQHADLVLPISQSDQAYFANRHDQVRLLPAFHQMEEVTVKEGTGDYVLIQGDLRLPHNVRIVSWVAPICAELGMRCIVAGRAASRKSAAILRPFQNIEIVSDVSQETMRALMLDAQVQVVDAGTTAGFKIKLLAALFSGRHVVAHTDILDEDLASIARGFNNRDQLRRHLSDLVDRPALPEEVAKRRAVLLPRFSNHANAHKLLDLLPLTQ
ncbi:MAG: hypothetical protein R3301_00500 [Saprospiraceae bacterium]|nr:hypothetical protein [Saprospiraceae bacterium]